MLPQMLFAFALVFAAAPVQAQSDAVFEVRIGRPGIRVHGLGAPAGEVIRVHGATHLADIPTHGLADAFQPSRPPLDGEPGETQIRVHWIRLQDAFRPSRIRVHGLANP